MGVSMFSASCGAGGCASSLRWRSRSFYISAPRGRCQPTVGSANPTGGARSSLWTTMSVNLDMSFASVSRGRSVSNSNFTWSLLRSYTQSTSVAWSRPRLRAAA